VKKLSKIFSIGLFVYLFIGSFVYSANAQTQPINITASPTLFDLSLKPGDTVTKSFRVRNNTTTSVPLSITLKKIIPDTGGQLIVQDFKNTDSYQSWLTVATATPTAAPQEWTTVQFTLNIPKDAAFGYYWAIVVAPSSISGNLTTSGAHITGALAIPVLLAVQKEGITFGGKLLDFITDASFYEYLPTTFLTTLENNGNIHIRPTGDIFITDWTGKQVGFVKVNPDFGAILPNAKRTFATTWNDSFITRDPKIEDGKVMTDSKGHPEYAIHFHFDKVLSLRIGKYKASELVVISGDKKDISFERTLTFFVFPWKIVLGLLVVILLAALGLWNTIHTLWKHGRKVFRRQ